MEGQTNKKNTGVRGFRIMIKEDQEKKIEKLLSKHNSMYIDFIRDEWPSGADVDRDGRISEIAALTIELDRECMKSPHLPISRRGMGRSSEAAAILLKRWSPSVYKSGNLESLFNINPNPGLLSSFIYKGMNNDDESFREGAIQASNMGGYVLNKKFKYSDLSYLGKDFALRVTKNLLNNARIDIHEKALSENHNLSVFYQSAMNMLSFAAMNGDIADVFNFIDKEKKLISEAYLDVQHINVEPVEYLLGETKLSSITSEIKQHAPAEYRRLLHSGKISSNILSNMFNDDYDLGESTYLEALNTTDIVNICSESVIHDENIDVYDSIDYAFRGYGKGSLWDNMAGNKHIIELRDSAQDFVNDLDKRSYEDARGSRSNTSMSLIHKYLEMDMRHSSESSMLLNTDRLRDKWAAFIIHAEGRFTCQDIEVGPLQSHAIISKIISMIWAPLSVPERFTNSPVFKETIASLPEDRSKKLIDACPDWEYLRKIKFKEASANSHMISTDLGL